MPPPANTPPQDSASISYNRQPDSTIVELKRMDLDAGVLGRFFGGKASAPANIAGLIVTLLTVFAIGLTFWKGTSEATPLWNIVLPVITLALGYLFGKEQKK